MMTPHERSFEIYPDYILSAKHWHNPQGIPTLGFHGWLDNAATFDHLAPMLDHLDLVSLDFSGHGLSSHKCASCFFHILDLVVEGFLVADHLGWKSFALLGHSLGAAVASYMAGTQPQKVTHLMLLDGLGALTTPAKDSPHQLELFINTLMHKKSSQPPVYATPEQAIAARRKVTPISFEGAKALSQRGLKEVKGGYTWRTDPRLLRPSAIQLTNSQTFAFLERIKAQTLIIRPQPGFPFNEDMMKERIGLIKNLTLSYVEGEHHAHLDTPEAIAPLINTFTNQTS